MDLDHIKKIHEYDKMIKKVQLLRKKKFNNYHKMINQLKTSKSLVKKYNNHCKKKNKIVQIILLDLNEKNKKNIYNTKNTNQDINNLKEYLKLNIIKK